MTTLARTDNSVLTRWWWAVDRWQLAALVVLAGTGAMMALAASPPVAERLGLGTYHFAARQAAYLGLGLFIAVTVSLLSPRGIRRLAMVLTAGSVLLMVLVLAIGPEIKGATRWLPMGGFSLQPSEFVKPGFAVTTAWFFAQARLNEGYPGNFIATGLFLTVAALLLMQPDVGMTMVVACVWGTQFFLAGLPLLLVMGIGVGFLVAAIGVYFTFGHVRARIDRFFDPGAGEGYQIMRSLDAFKNGGLTGAGPGEGRVKEVLPDAHTDFIFAVAGEEFGMLVCVAIVCVFAFVVIRGMARIYKADNLFIMLAAAGLLVQFAVQTMINLASTLHLIPPKGMTLPFVSYGGSSTIAVALGFGMMLALTRDRPGEGNRV
ncbi:MAG: putative peptidoglycan glycosyltransferase FtsW [Rhodospirillaceae bacterium]